MPHSGAAFRLKFVASKSSGVDAEAAAEYGVRVIHALGLPGRCKPVSAGEILAQTVTELLDKAEGGAPDA